MKNILVTGGAGFIGSHLCNKLLEKGNRVINLDNFNDYYNPCFKRMNIAGTEINPNYFLVQGDIRNDEMLDLIFSKYKIDAVVHLAALAGVRNSLENPKEYMDVDVKGTVNILEYCRKNNVSKVVFASSSSVYGMRKIPFYEYDVIDSQESPYAAAKAAGELICRTYSNIYGLPIVCLRFFTVYGPRQRPEMAIHKFTRLIDEGKEIEIFGDGNSSRDYTYVEDIVEGILASIDHECKFEIFNLGNSHTISMNSLISVIENKVGKPAIKKYTGMQSGDVINTCADITKAYMLLNYNPKTSIEEGIEKFVKWYNEYKVLYKI